MVFAASLGAALATGFASTGDVAQVVTASGFVYLGAAALRRRSSAWPLFLVTFVLIGVGFVVPGFVPSWWMVGLAGILLAYALARGALRPGWGVPLQTAAMVALATAAIVATHLGVPWAGLLVGAALLAHAGWDLYHHCADRVVSCSMAEFCGVLDVLLAAMVVVATLAG